MFSLATILLLVIAAAGNMTVDGKPSTCTRKYEGTGRLTHTMCLTDSPSATQVTLTQEVKDAILSRHNEIRASVSPTATNMQKMVWDERLALVAAKWAMQCDFGHDLNHDEPELPGFVGQNVYMARGTFHDAVTAWFEGRQFFTYGKQSFAALDYIQEVFHSSALVGCGQATCQMRHPLFDTLDMFVCNYFTGPDDLARPYEEGSACGQCPDQCDETGTLCDCGGKVCGEEKEMNLNTCQCQSWWEQHHSQ